ncbi:dof zinc finger protein DOF1.4-like [Punica granatum]|uniref:Dof zinc finger protein n=2 Tax=Punica granatum TaxID=22663 RepID=A0A218WXB0_PUNGR|nr:dof zinc finger protein DOF1.4-like [Punica granatum]OWM77495.1 hypothetical protein CDL15_Pgr016892 [Punica granatum]PKI69300.1 hypothetical protein CRG98_010301 [Punica granatum]
MGLRSKLVSSDVPEFDWSSSQTLLRGQAVINDLTPRSAPGKSEPPGDRCPNQSEQLKCPRCESTNTKFCYFNNYNKSQPRHFCKSCKRHWTKGGTLRNVPVGGSRKNKRLKTAATTTSSSSTAAMPVAAAITSSAVAKHNKPAIDDQTFVGLNVISDDILPVPDQDILSSVQFSSSGMSDSVITSIMPASVYAVPNLPMVWQASVGQEAAASFWSWEDIGLDQPRFGPG